MLLWLWLLLYLQLEAAVAFVDVVAEVVTAFVGVLMVFLQILRLEF